MTLGWGVPSSVKYLLCMYEDAGLIPIIYIKKVKHRGAGIDNPSAVGWRAETRGLLLLIGQLPQPSQ